MRRIPRRVVSPLAAVTILFTAAPTPPLLSGPSALAPASRQQHAAEQTVAGVTPLHSTLIGAALGNLKVGDKLGKSLRIESLNRRGETDIYTVSEGQARLEITLDPPTKSAHYRVVATDAETAESLARAARQILGLIPVASRNKTLLHRVKAHLEKNLQAGNMEQMDQYVPPQADESYPGMEEGSVFLWFNTRSDRSKIIARAFTEAGFKDFPIEEGIAVLHDYFAMKPHVKSVKPHRAAYPAIKVQNHLTETLSRAGVAVLKVAEKQKEAHVTSFFNGENEAPYAGESWRIVESPKPDKKAKQTMAHFPQMSAADTTPLVLAGMGSQKVEIADPKKKALSKNGEKPARASDEYAGEGFPLIVVNYANADQVGHEGEFEPAVAAVAAVDSRIGEILKKADEEGYIVISTADHGNAEEMLTARGQKSTKHSIRNPVHFAIYDPLLKNSDGTVRPAEWRCDEELGKPASLAHIAPTILQLMGQPAPSEMEKSLLKNYPALVDSHGKKRKVVLVIKDGWGEAPHAAGNAVTEAARRGLTPATDLLLSQFPHRNILPYGVHVGAQDGKMGDSDKGHTTMGAGRVVKNLLTQVDEEIASGAFFNNEALLEAMETARMRGKPLHIGGLLSDEGVHADHTHLFALLELAAQRGVKEAWVHPCLDGRDSDPGTALYYLLQLDAKIAELEEAHPGMRIQIGSLSGRDWGMARGTDFHLTHKAFVPMRYGSAVPFTEESAGALLEAFRAETDSHRKKLLADRISHFIDRLNNVKNVWFDLGGVLLDTPATEVAKNAEKWVRGLYAEEIDAWQAKLKKEGKKADLRAELQRIFFTGDGAKKLRESRSPRDIFYPQMGLADYSFPEFTADVNAELKKLLDLPDGSPAIAEEQIHDLLYRAHGVTPGAPELTQKLRQRGLMLRVLSNHFPDSTGVSPPEDKTTPVPPVRFKPNEFQLGVIEKIFGKGNFDPEKDVYFSNRLSVAKPDRGFFRIAETLEKAEPGEVAYVDDQEGNVNWGTAYGYFTSLYAYNGSGALDDDFLLRELATGDWREEANSLLALSDSRPKNKLFIEDEDIDVAGKRVLVRVDFNVPVKGDKVDDDSRIRGALPTLRYLLSRGGIPVVMSHLGSTPKDELKKQSLAPVAERLRELLPGVKVIHLAASVGPEAEGAVREKHKGPTLFLLENLRWNKGEEQDKKKNPGFSEAEAAQFAEGLARLAEDNPEDKILICDAFGTAHRKDGSMHYLPQAIERQGGAVAAGYLMAKEIKYLGDIGEQLEHPFVLALGGAKVSSKLPIIEKFFKRMKAGDCLIIGGGMAYPFLKAMNCSVGSTCVGEDQVETARKVVKMAGDKGIEVLIPEDHVATDSIVINDKEKKLLPGAKIVVTEGADIPDSFLGVDIGPKTRIRFGERVRGAAMVLWNGPMGVFDADHFDPDRQPPFAEGTYQFARDLSRSRGKTIVGGGDSSSAIEKAAALEKDPVDPSRIFHISTGGGASVEFLEGKALPGIAAITDREIRRTPVIAANWKMNMTIAKALEFAGKLATGLNASWVSAKVVIAPPFTILAKLADALKALAAPIAVAGQDLHWEEKGAFTGKISAAMLLDAGATGVIIGHSEQRTLFGETNQTVNKKVRAALKVGLVPIVCVGETLNERENGQARQTVSKQIRESLAGLTAEEGQRCVIAYEPVWAIGTGRTATPAQAQEMHRLIRDGLRHLFGKWAARRIRIQYGGSVTPKNVPQLMGQPDIDGALVGGASLEADSFMQIVGFKPAAVESAL